LGTQSDFTLIEEMATGGAGDGRALLRAVEHNDEKALKAALAVNGVDVDFQHPEDAVTPLIVAVEKNRLNLVKILVERGADVNLEANSFSEGSPATIAKKRGFKDIEQFLLEHGAEYSNDVDFFDDSLRKASNCVIL